MSKSKAKKRNRKENQATVSVDIYDAKDSTPADAAECHGIHQFTEIELEQLRQNLLHWYDKNKRTLPWRTVATSDAPSNQRAYAVLVSEMMLQQTQVATVVNYYTKWMARWPTLPDLAAASLEEVNEMWTGLGYYSRGRRLFEIACKVHSEMDGNIPNTTKELEQLPGVGPYTAGAVASIAFSERAPVVDGNVIRVMARLRAIGACTTTTVVNKALWKLADQSVDLIRPGDFNQALMELGATVCTARNPQCDSCPIASLCLAKKRAEKTTSQDELKDIEEVPGCNLCLSSHKWEPSIGVMNYPRKEKKTNVSQQETAVCVLHRSTSDGFEFFLEQRPKTGLLANLWQFPNIDLPLGLSDDEVLKVAMQSLQVSYNITKPYTKVLGRVPHQFSHISQVYVVLSVFLDDQHIPRTPAQSQQWAPVTALNQIAIPTGMKKVFKLFSTQDTGQLPPKKKRKVAVTEVGSKKNRLLTEFFAPRKSAVN